MSKKLKIIFALISTFLISGIAFIILNPKKPSSKPESEVTIEQTAVLGSSTVIYEDWAGFSFEYTEGLTIQEIELNDDSVYSSLEIIGPDNQKIILKITDASFKDLASWQEEFEKDNLVSSIKEIYWADIPGLQLLYGAPKKLLTVAYNDNIFYYLESSADDDFWEKTHNNILNSFQFTLFEEIIDEVSTSPSPEPEETPDIVLMEEEII